MYLNFVVYRIFITFHLQYKSSNKFIFSTYLLTTKFDSKYLLIKHNKNKIKEIKRSLLLSPLCKVQTFNLNNRRLLYRFQFEFFEGWVKLKASPPFRLRTIYHQA